MLKLIKYFRLFSILKSCTYPVLIDHPCPFKLFINIIFHSWNKFLYIFIQDEQKCFICDSNSPYDLYNNRNSHRIENIITTFEPERKMRWWQSENGEYSNWLILILCMNIKNHVYKYSLNYNEISMEQLKYNLKISFI